MKLACNLRNTPAWNCKVVGNTIINTLEAKPFDIFSFSSCLIHENASHSIKVGGGGGVACLLGFVVFFSFITLPTNITFAFQHSRKTRFQTAQYLSYIAGSFTYKCEVKVLDLQQSLLDRSHLFVARIP